MDKKALMVRVASALTTLAETSGCPESTLYMALCDSDMASWEVLRSILLRTGFVTIKSHWVTLTPLGKEYAAKIQAVIEA